MIGAIEKSIRNADLGLNPSNDGKLIRLPIPPLTEERRRDMAKKLNHVAEERRVGPAECAAGCERTAEENAEGKADQRR